MIARRIGNPSRVPPFPGEVRVLLGLLVGRQPGEDAEPWLYGMVGVGWIESARGGVAITDAGRETLASWLLRDFAGPVVAVEEQPIMSAADVGFLLAALRGEALPGMFANHPGAYTRCRDNGWLLAIRSLSDIRRCITPAGRDALAAYLLRGWRP